MRDLVRTLDHVCFVYIKALLCCSLEPCHCEAVSQRGAGSVRYLRCKLLACHRRTAPTPSNRAVAPHGGYSKLCRVRSQECWSPSLSIGLRDNGKPDWSHSTAITTEQTWHALHMVVALSRHGHLCNFPCRRTYLDFHFPRPKSRNCPANAAVACVSAS